MISSAAIYISDDLADQILVGGVDNSHLQDFLATTGASRYKNLEVVVSYSPEVLPAFRLVIRYYVGDFANGSLQHPSVVPLGDLPRRSPEGGIGFVYLFQVPYISVSCVSLKGVAYLILLSKGC